MVGEYRANIEVETQLERRRRAHPYIGEGV